MANDHFERHRALTATPQAKKEELQGARRLCYFFGLLALTQAVLGRSWPAAILTIPCVFLELANHAAGMSRGAKLFLLAAISAGFAEVAVLLSMFIEKAPRFGTLILGALIAWVAFRSRRVFRDLHSIRAEPVVTAQRDGSAHF